MQCLLVRNSKVFASLPEHWVEVVELGVVNRREEVVHQVVTEGGKTDEVSSYRLVNIIGGIELVEPPVCLSSTVVS